MRPAELRAEAALLRTALAADGVCIWRTDAEGVAMPVGCAPEGWVDSGFLPPAAGADAALAYGEAALGRLPFVVGARLDAAPAAVLAAGCGDGGGFFALWRAGSAVPPQAAAIGEAAHGACAAHFAHAGLVERALEAHLQMRSLVAALPQGVAIVPNRGRRGFANAAAARLLDLAEGEVELGELATALNRFAARTQNVAEVQAQVESFVAGADRTLIRGCIWRFAQPPQALRVTVAPIGERGADGWVWLLDDISAEELAKDLLREREEKFSLFYRSLQDAVVFFDMDGRLIEWNEPFRKLIGHPDDVLARMTMAELTPPAWRGRLAARIGAELERDGHSARHEKELVRADGRAIPVEARTFLRRDVDGRPVAMWEVVHDITERKRAEAQLVLAAQVFDRASDGVVLTSPERTILTANDAFLAMSGHARLDLVGEKLDFLRLGHQDDAFHDALWAQLAERGWWQGEVWSRKRQGDIYLKWVSLSAVKDEAGAVTHYIAMVRDAEQVGEAHRRIEYLATHDELTGLPNRTLFADRLELALARAQRQQRLVALVLVDLDEFNAINDGFGHRTGDALLKQAAERLTRALRGDDSVARHGGDEFSLLIEAGALDEVANRCQAMLAALAAPYRIDGLELAVPASAGVAVFPADGADLETLLRKADTALHRAKHRGRNNYSFFTSEMAEQVSRRLQIESGLRQALARGELFMMYQPQLSPDGSHLIGSEALVRWRRGGEIVPPGQFIPIAERSSLIVDLSDWVLAEVCRQVGRWTAQGLPVGQVSVNTSARHFQLDDMARRVAAQAAAAQVDPARICIEITEGALMEPARSVRALDELKAAGFHTSIDDFGTGFSSLSYLKRFPIDELKIDKSFVDGIASDDSDRAIVAATLSMAKSLGLRVVAEGVETGEQLRYLQQQRCDIMQGYLFSRPLEVAEFEAYVKNIGGAPAAP